MLLGYGYLLQPCSSKPATRKVAGRSPAMGFIFLFVAGLKANCCNLRLRLRFSQNHLLEINEAIIVSRKSLRFLDYRDHSLTLNGNLHFIH